MKARNLLQLRYVIGQMKIVPRSFGSAVTLKSEEFDDWIADLDCILDEEGEKPQGEQAEP